MIKTRSTTVLCVHRNGVAAMGADGQITRGEQIIAKSTAIKMQKLRAGRILAGFAGATADALMLLDMFEKKLEAHQGRLRRAAEDLAKTWRTDRMLRRLEAELAASSADEMYLISGLGDVIEPEHGVLAIGSGMGYATAAARAMLKHTKKGAAEIVQDALEITADLCVFTNHNITLHTIDAA